MLSKQNEVNSHNKIRSSHLNWKACTGRIDAGFDSHCENKSYFMWHTNDVPFAFLSFTRLRLDQSANLLPMVSFFRNSVLYRFQSLWEHNHKWKIYVRTNINIKANRNTLNASGENQTKLTDWDQRLNKSTQNAIIYMYICGSIFKNRFVFTSQTNKMRVARLRSNSNNNNDG